MALNCSRNALTILTKVPKQRISQSTTALNFTRQYGNNEEHILKSPYPDIHIPKVPLHQFIWKDINQWADKVALQCSVTKKQYKYSEAQKTAKQIAAVMQQNFRLGKGDCIALFSPNIPEYPLFIVGSSEAGLVLTTINSGFTADEVVKQLVDSKAKVLITIPSMFQTAKSAIEKIGKDIPICVLQFGDKVDVPKGGIPLDELIASAPAEVQTVPFDHCDNIVLPYSSGTTGLCKGVQLSHYNLIANLGQIASPFVRLLLPTTETQQESVLSVLPMYHIYGMVPVALGTIAEGGRLVTFPKFDPKQFVSGIYDFKIGLMYLVPPLVLFLADSPTVTPEHLKNVRVYNTGAAPIGAADTKRFNKKAPHVLQFQGAAPLGASDAARFKEKGPHILPVQGYGLTETSPVIAMSHKKRLDVLASSGVPVPNTIFKITDPESGKSLPAGEVGELLVQGPQVMKGYLNNEEANKTIFSDRWLRTGDLGYYDNDGNLFIVDRLKELIKVKGMQVAPAELEALLREHPDITDSAVIGVSDKRAGELPRAYVVKAPNAKITEQDVKDFVAGRVAKHKRLEGGVIFIEAIPKSAAGKILRKNLRE